MFQRILLFFIFISLANAQHFTKITAGPQSNDGGDSRCVNWVDLDHDGDLDLFITNGPSAPANNFLYRNNGDGTFAKVTDLSIVNDPGSYDGATWADYDNDGTIDLFAATWYGQKNSLHRRRKGTFEEVFPRAIADDNTFSETASWGDYDNDGYVDLYLANSSGDLRNILYHNNGNGTFTKVTTGSIVTDGAPTRSVDWCDFDNDGDLDLFTANEGGSHEALYWNLGNGTFAAEAGSALVSDAGDSFGSSVADVDNDGDFDILIVNHANQNEALFLNNGNKTFTKVTAGPVVNSGGSSVGSAFGDLDNDGDLDLMVTNAFAGNARVTNFLYWNNGDGTFTKADTGIVTTDLGWSYGVAFGDYDRDGDLDIATANCFGANQNNALYRNEGNANAWLTVIARGTVSNRSAIGARIRVKALINGTPVWQVRQVAGQSGYCGQNLEAHFGLGNAAVIDSLVVTFPSGKSVVQTNVPVKQLLTVTEPVPPGFFRGQMQIGTFRGMSPLSIEFNDISYGDPAQPASHWSWDLNNDGVADAVTASAQFQYSIADTYSVKLIVGNGSKTDTIRATKALLIEPSRSVIGFNTATHNFGTIDVNLPKKDTTMFLYNRGKLTDTVTVSLIYGSSSPGTVKPDSALDVTPHSFTIAPGDSQGITFTIFPRRVIRTNLNITYTPKIVVATRNNIGANLFEKTMWVKLTGTLVPVRSEGALPSEFRLDQNFPNPFNPRTTIRFSVPVSAAEERVLIEVFSILGERVATLVDSALPSGDHAVQWDGASEASGTYVVRYQRGGNSAVRTMMLLK